MDWLSQKADSRNVTRLGATCAAFCLLLQAIGCAQHTRVCMPRGLLAPQTTIDLHSTADVDHTRDRAALTAALERIKATEFREVDPAAKKYNILALSGGGSYGAFSAGVLNGWTRSGERPEFDIVSGVSTGALIATYAFLGPRYDSELREFYTSKETSDIYTERCKAAVLWSESYVKSAPLERLIEENITAQLMCEVARAHALGKRLYIGTTNVDTGQLVIWDLGAIASRGNHDALALYRKIVLASASPPGFFPPVPIEVTVNGVSYTELHVDGGTTAQVFFRSSMIPLDPAEFSDGRSPLAGSRVYVIVAGKAFPDPQCAERRALSIAATSLGALTSAQTRNDLVRIYTLTMLTGMEFRVATIPQQWRVAEDSMTFEPAAMQSLYKRGYQWGVDNRAWAELPPVLDASEQSTPRAGTDFLAPLHAAP